MLENQPWLREPLPSELVTLAILQKHCDFYHMSSASSSNNSRASATPRNVATVPDTPQNERSGFLMMPEIPECDVVAGIVNVNGISSNEGGGPGNESAATQQSTAATVAAAAELLAAKEIILPKRVPSDSHCYSPTAVRNFQKRVINIVHPLTNANMISATVTSERVSKICQILEIGAIELHTSLKISRGIRRGEGEGDENKAPLPTPFEKFFRGIIVRFSNGWRPDIFDTSLPGHIPSGVTESDTESNRIVDFNGLQVPHAVSEKSVSVLPVEDAALMTLSEANSRYGFIHLYSDIFMDKYMNLNR